MGITSIIIDPIKNALLLRRPGQSPLSLPNLDGQQFYAKNYVINGGFDFFQRSTSLIAIPGSSAYTTADRWRFEYGGGTTSTSHGRDTSRPSGRARNWMRLTGTHSSNSGLYARQRIESAWAAELKEAGSMSLSFLVNNNAMTQVYLQLTYASAENNFTTGTTYHTTASQTINATSVNQTVKFENLPVNANMVNGLEVSLVFHTPITTGVGLNTYFSEVMLNAGPKCAVFTRAGQDLQGELALCQRYFYQVASESTDAALAQGHALSASVWMGRVTFPVTMRTVPTFVTLSGQVAADYRLDGQSLISAPGNLPTMSSTGPSGAQIMLTNSGTAMTVGQGYFLMANTGSNAKLNFQAEL